MKFEFTPNGNLQIISEPEDAEMLADLKHRHEGDDISFLGDLLDQTGWLGNAELMPIKPEHVGALTDAPMLSDDITYEDDGDVTVHGRVWWFPNYMITNFADVLINKGSVIFTLAPEVTA